MEQANLFGRFEGGRVYGLRQRKKLIIGNTGNRVWQLR
jgi:hypothetical protein